LTGASTWILARFGRFQLYKVKIKWNSYECLLREGKKEEGGKTLVEKLTWLDSGIFRKINVKIKIDCNIVGQMLCNK
jgi:hypothetical protein